jgi:glycerol-3-phosphate dehydrogenase
MAGVWIDELVRDASPRARRKVFGTKGCHIVVKLPADCRGLGIATLNSRNEPFYCIPWKQLHYFGPTETPYDGDPDQVFATDEETAWLVAEANRLLPNLKLTLADVRLTWAGVRPLTYDKAVPSGNRSRAIHDLAGDGLADAFAMTAGPVMTHRSGAREIVRLVAQRIAPSGPAGTPDYAPPATDRGGLDHAETLSDVLFRRRGTAWSGSRQEEQAPREQGREEDALTAVAAEIAAILHWDERRAARELADHRAELATLFRPGVH